MNMIRDLVLFFMFLFGLIAGFIINPYFFSITLISMLIILMGKPKEKNKRKISKTKEVSQ
jgi:predicted membrane protein